MSEISGSTSGEEKWHLPLIRMNIKKFTDKTTLARILWRREQV